MPQKALVDKFEEELQNEVLIKIIDPFHFNIDEKDISKNAKNKRDEQ